MAEIVARASSLSREGTDRGCASGSAKERARNESARREPADGGARCESSVRAHDVGARCARGERRKRVVGGDVRRPPGSRGTTLFGSRVAERHRWSERERYARVQRRSEQVDLIGIDGALKLSARVRASGNDSRSPATRAGRRSCRKRVVGEIELVRRGAPTRRGTLVPSCHPRNDATARPVRSAHSGASSSIGETGGSSRNGVVGEDAVVRPDQAAALEVLPRGADRSARSRRESDEDIAPRATSSSRDSHSTTPPPAKIDAVGTRAAHLADSGGTVRDQDRRPPGPNRPATLAGALPMPDVIALEQIEPDEKQSSRARTGRAQLPEECSQQTLPDEERFRQ